METKRIVRFLVGFICVAFSIGLLASGVDAQGTADTKRKVIKLRVASGHPPSSLWIEKIHSFFVPELKKRVLEQTKDSRVECEELWGGSVTKLGEELEAVESGMVDIANVSIVFEMTKMHLQNFPWWFPFGSSDMHQVLRVSHKTWDKFPILDQTMEKYKQKRIALGGLGSYNFVTHFPIRTMEDMKGKKLAHGGPMVPWIQAVGAVGVQSRLNEAYTCMQTGVYDGWAMEPNATVSFKLYEVGRYYTLVGLGAGLPSIVTVSLKTFNRLPKQVQDIVLKVGKDYEKVYTDASVKDYNASIEFMRGKGVTIHQMPEAERMRFAKAMDDARVADVMAKESDKMGFPGSELARFYIKAMSEDGYKWPFVPTIK